MLDLADKYFKTAIRTIIVTHGDKEMCSSLQNNRWKISAEIRNYEIKQQNFQN